MSGARGVGARVDISERKGPAPRRVPRNESADGSAFHVCRPGSEARYTAAQDRDGHVAGIPDQRRGGGPPTHGGPRNRGQKTLPFFLPEPGNLTWASVD